MGGGRGMLRVDKEPLANAPLACVLCIASAWHSMETTQDALYWAQGLMANTD